MLIAVGDIPGIPKPTEKTFSKHTNSLIGIGGGHAMLPQDSDDGNPRTLTRSFSVGLTNILSVLRDI